MEQIKKLLRKYKDAAITEEENLFLEYLLIDQIERFVLEQALSREERLLLEEWERERLFYKETRYFDVFLKREADAGALASWRNFSEKMHFPLPGTDAPDELPARRNRKYPPRRHITSIASAAAMLAIVLGVLIYQPFARPAVYFAEGGMMSFRLPDSTHIVMNEGSELIVPSRFNGRTRSVKMKGEIFFDVTPDARKPFIIRHGELTTEVKGTSFTIRDYAGLDENAVIVTSGIVEVSSARRPIATLTPNQQLSYDKPSATCAISTVDAAAQSAWTHGRIVLRNASEKELALRLMQRYRMHLAVKNRALGENVCINSEFNDETRLSDWLQSLSMVYGAAYEIVGDTVVFGR